MHMIRNNDNLRCVSLWAMLANPAPSKYNSPRSVACHLMRILRAKREVLHNRAQLCEARTHRSTHLARGGRGPRLFPPPHHAEDARKRQVVARAGQSSRASDVNLALRRHPHRNSVVAARRGKLPAGQTRSETALWAHAEGQGLIDVVR